MSEFTDYLHEVFEHFGPIPVRRMFGEQGIFCDDVMFALVAEEILYLKVDSACLELFEELGLSAFEYQRQGKTIKLSYPKPPGRCSKTRKRQRCGHSAHTQRQ